MKVICQMNLIKVLYQRTYEMFWLTNTFISKYKYLKNCDLKVINVVFCNLISNMDVNWLHSRQRTALFADDHLQMIAVMNPAELMVTK